jgi:hypothetical protein
MTVDKLIGRIVAVGQRHDFDMDFAREELERILYRNFCSSKNCDVEEEGNGTVHYNLKGPEIEISISDYPINFDDWSGFLRKHDHLPEEFFKDYGPKSIIEVKGNLRVVLSSEEHDWGVSWTSERKLYPAERIFHHSRVIFQGLKKYEDKIVPKRRLELLMDNEHKLFRPGQFRNYITKNQKAVMYAYDGSLSEE